VGCILFQACGVLRAIEPLNSFLASLCKFTINNPNDGEKRRYATVVRFTRILTGHITKYLVGRIIYHMPAAPSSSKYLFFPFSFAKYITSDVTSNIVIWFVRNTV